uniref:Reverse transcriptase Ty1/copia-type domain-containing protein n=1 Tax=Globisporangium ultimum (strain ATCC 200006 / CBS 805.95 / DAOM BR144) TaxID=431595 RepID=K3WY77_GLOUD
ALGQITSKLEERFKIKILGPVRKFLGISVYDTDTCYFLAQHTTVRYALAAHNFEHMRPVAAPMDPESEDLVDLHQVGEALDQSTIRVMKNGSFSAKHIALRYHFIKDEVSKG